MSENGNDGTKRSVKGWGCPECYRSKADYVVGVEIPDECPTCANGNLETWDTEPPWQERELTPMDKRW
jgi:rubrerythrin